MDYGPSAASGCSLDCVIGETRSYSEPLGDTTEGSNGLHGVFEATRFKAALLRKPRLEHGSSKAVFSDTKNVLVSAAARRDRVQQSHRPTGFNHALFSLNIGQVLEPLSVLCHHGVLVTEQE